MTNIAFIISNLKKQGPINQLLYLCKNINKNEFKVHIITLYPIGECKTMHAEFKKYGIEIVDLNIGKLFSIIKGRILLNKYIIGNDIEIIQSFGFIPDLICHRISSVYKITSVRNRLLYNYKMMFGSFKGYIFGHLNLSFIKKFDKIVACSSSIQSYLENLNIKSQIILNCIEIDNSAYNNIKNNGLLFYKEKFNIDLNKKTFISISSQIKGKNIEFILETFINSDLINKFNLIIAGFVEQSTINLYKNFPNIHFIGKVDNIYEYYEASDFFISASLHEGMPNAVLEAMALGKPVILSNIPAHIEITNTVNSFVGIIFDNNNESDLLNAINKISLEDYKELESNCIAAIQQYFNPNKMTVEYEKIYRIKR